MASKSKLSKRHATQTLVVLIYISAVILITDCLIHGVDELIKKRGLDVDTDMKLVGGGKLVDSVTVDSGSDKSRFSEPPPGTLMGRKQIEAILNVLPEHGNLLVWGIGYDSILWHSSTTGRVIFIEPKGYWLDKVLTKYPFLEVYAVVYTTQLNYTVDKYLHHPELWQDLDMRAQLPITVTQTRWDVIIVDAPEGWGDGPGRYQSIYTASLLASHDSHVFVDDFERHVEHVYSRKMLGEPIEVIERPVVNGQIGWNLQAHFYKSWTGE